MKSPMNIRYCKSGALLILLLLVIPAWTQARELGETDVRRAIESWVRTVTADARPEASIISMEPYREDGETLAYIAYLSDRGFCLCGADDLVLPVYYYSPQGTYDPNNSKYQCLLREIGDRLKQLRESAASKDQLFSIYQDALLERSVYWASLIAGRVPERRNPLKNESKTDPESMRIDFAPHWHQDSPYNDQCPELTPAGDDHVKVGASALAMAQIMYYWQWPRVGEDNASVDYQYRYRHDWQEDDLAFDPGIPAIAIWENRLQWVPDGGGKLRLKGYWDESLYLEARNLNDNSQFHDILEDFWKDLTKATDSYSVDFSAQTYNWNIIENEHEDVPSASAAEAAKICYHAGVAAENTYGVIETDANLSYLKNAFKDHFYYDNDVKEEGKNIDNLTEEIQYYRPAAFQGDDPVDGTHAWVFYGYNKGTDPDRQFLTNMGWGGDDDGWYTCDNIGYASSQREVIRIAPENVVRFVGGTSSGDGTPEHPFLNLDEALVAVADSITLIFKAGTTIPFTGSTLILDRPMVLKGKMVLGE